MIRNEPGEATKEELSPGSLAGAIRSGWERACDVQSDVQAPTKLVDVIFL